MDEQDVTELSGLVLNRATQFVHDDEAWRKFGYKDRPKYGTLFQKLRKQWKVKLERNLYREIIFMHVAFSFKSIDKTENQAPIEDMIILMAYNLSGDGSTYDIYKDFGFDEKEAFVDHVITSVKKYLNTPISKVSNVFLENIKFREIPNAQKKADIMKGISFLSSYFSSYLNK